MHVRASGDWPPHVHFRMGIERPATRVAGVVSSSDHVQWKLLYPRLVLGDLYKGHGSGSLGIWVDGDAS